MKSIRSKQVNANESYANDNEEFEFGAIAAYA
jgi:hypothetical protein